MYLPFGGKKHHLVISTQPKGRYPKPLVGGYLFTPNQPLVEVPVFVSAQVCHGDARNAGHVGIPRSGSFVGLGTRREEAKSRFHLKVLKIALIIYYFSIYKGLMMKVNFFQMLGLFWTLEISKSCFLNGSSVFRLNYLNANGYVHRDIKPENIMYKVQPPKLNANISHIQLKVLTVKIFYAK